MGFMSSQLFDITGRFISCIVTTLVFFRFFDARYIRLYNLKVMYFTIKVSCILLNFCVYLINKPIANVLYWIFIILLISRFLYLGEQTKKIIYYLINISFFFAYSVCESIGCVLVSSGIKILNIEQSEYIVSFIYTIGGSISAVLLYYLILQRLFIVEKNKKISAKQYFIYVIITIYVLVNIGSILFLLQHKLNNKDYIFLLLDAIFVVILNLYLFYLLDAFAENRNLKYRLEMYEQQAKINYDYYAKQMESNKKAMAVIHDIRKHIRVMNELKQSEASSQLEGYTEVFEEMIEPLMIKQYSDSAILNIIINDKIDYCQKNSILFEVDIQPVSLGFMEPIDVTTIFGNILDNAIEACEKAQEKKIILKICPYNEMIYVQLSNTYVGNVQWNHENRPKTQKGEGHGIGLENVDNTLHKYDGSMEFSAEDGWFTVEIMFSK